MRPANLIVADQVNNDGRFGTWAYYQTPKPIELKSLLGKFHERAVKGEPITG